MSTSKAPRASIIIAAYNAEKFLGRAAGSLFSQTLKDIEIIIVDDASTDSTADIISSLTADPRVRTFRNSENLGPGETRNRGLDLATGKWIGVLDADDAYQPNRLEKLIDVAEKNELDVIADLLEFHDLAAGHTTNIVSNTYRLELLDPVSLVESSALDEAPVDYGLLKPIVCHDLVANGTWRYPDVRHGEDFSLYFKVLMEGFRFGVWGEALYTFSTRFGIRSGEFSPGTVTSVDYSLLENQTRDFLKSLNPDDPNTRALSDLFRRRIERIKRLNQRYGWMAFRSRSWPRFFRWLGQDWKNGPRFIQTFRPGVRQRLFEKR